MLYINNIINDLTKVAEVKKTKRLNKNTIKKYKSFLMIFLSIMINIIIIGMITNYINAFKFNFYGLLLSILVAYAVVVFEHETYYKINTNQNYSTSLMVTISVIDIFALLGLLIVPSISIAFRSMIPTFEYFCLVVIIIFSNLINLILNRSKYLHLKNRIFNFRCIGFILTLIMTSISLFIYIN
ncbi:hypothetical protein RJG79_12580 [Mycoplasmatota bacterium WC44]